MTYDFNYKDNEGDEYQSDEYSSKKEAQAEVQRLRKLYDGDFQVTESWIYNDSGDYKGSWY